jgi:hypothetical protein
MSYSLLLKFWIDITMSSSRSKALNHYFLLFE